jgi:hypothetical protein
MDFCYGHPGLYRCGRFAEKWVTYLWYRVPHPDTDRIAQEIAASISGDEARSPWTAGSPSPKHIKWGMN